jgi:UDP-glucose 4-epimerase
MKNILVTGGAGYIGSHVVNLLIDKEYNVTVIDNLVTGNLKLINKNAQFYNIDIGDEKNVNKILKKNHFDIVMHFAGLIRVDESVKEPKKYNEYNYKKAKVFLDNCIKNNLKKIIFSSTASVYGNPKSLKVSENDQLNPLNPYAETKLNFENYLKIQSETNNIQYVILRYFNVAGADEKMRSGLISKYSTHLIKIASEVAVGKKSELVINGNDYDTPDGTPVRDYIHVSDLADIHLVSAEYLFKNNQSDIFNCGYGKGFSVKEVIKTYNKFLEKKIKYRIGPKRSGDSKLVVANPEKFNKIMNWQPKFDNLEYILKTAYEWEKLMSRKKN